MNLEDALEIIRSSLPKKWADPLIPHLEPCIRIIPKRWTNGEMPFGRSRFGGNPDLPQDWPWPTWTASKREDVPTGTWEDSPAKERQLHFLGQINLEEIFTLNPGVLPAQGTLYFFYDMDVQPWGFDPKHRGGGQVLFFSGPISMLNNRRGPSNSEFQIYPCSLRFSQEWSLPGWKDSETFLDSELKDNLQEDSDFSETLEELITDLQPEEDPVHQLLGHPHIIQNPMKLECQLASHGVYVWDPKGYEDSQVQSLAQGAPDWRLLLQIDTDEDNPWWMWGDCGRLYFWIRQQDLKNKDFSQTWVILQCY